MSATKVRDLVFDVARRGADVPVPRGRVLRVPAALQWYVRLSLALLGFVELFGARWLQARIGGPSGIAGAAFTGLWLGVLSYTVPNLVS